MFPGEHLSALRAVEADDFTVDDAQERLAAKLSATRAFPAFMTCKGVGRRVEMNGRLREDLFQWSRENKLCHLLSIRYFWPIAHDQANAFPSVPVIEIECGLAALSKLQIPVPQRSAEHHLDTILIAGTVFCDAIQIKAFLLDLQDSQCFRSGSDTDGKARAVMSVQFACFQIQFVDKPP